MAAWGARVGRAELVAAEINASNAAAIGVVDCKRVDVGGAFAVGCDRCDWRMAAPSIAVGARIVSTAVAIVAVLRCRCASGRLDAPTNQAPVGADTRSCGVNAGSRHQIAAVLCALLAVIAVLWHKPATQDGIALCQFAVVARRLRAGDCFMLTAAGRKGIAEVPRACVVVAAVDRCVCAACQRLTTIICARVAVVA
jgi:hypothetical protein